MNNIPQWFQEIHKGKEEAIIIALWEDYLDEAEIDRRWDMRE